MVKGKMFGTPGSCQIPQPNPEGPQEGTPDPFEELPEALNADINLSAFFSLQTGQIISSEPALEENTNSSNMWSHFLHLNS
jgi:hypothetical protein